MATAIPENTHHANTAGTHAKGQTGKPRNGPCKACFTSRTSRITDPKTPASKTNPPPTDTPWGSPKQTDDLGQGLYSISTAGHDGLYIAGDFATTKQEPRSAHEVAKFSMNGKQQTPKSWETTNEHANTRSQATTREKEKQLL